MLRILSELFLPLCRYNNKSYKIDELDFDGSPEDTFEGRTGPTSFVQYYKQQYGIDVRDRKQPLLVSRKRQINQPKDAPPLEIKLIPELCFLTGMTESQRQDFRCMKDVAEFTRQPPEKRRQTLTALLKSILDNKAASQDLGGWGLKLGLTPMPIDARVIGMSTLTFGGGQKETVSTTNRLRTYVSDFYYHVQWLFQFATFNGLFGSLNVFVCSRLAPAATGTAR